MKEATLFHLNFDFISTDKLDGEGETKEQLTPTERNQLKANVSGVCDVSYGCGSHIMWVDINE